MSNKVYWTTKDGRKIDVDTWSDLQHMRNVLKYLIREQQDRFDEDFTPNYGDLQDVY